MPESRVRVGTVMTWSSEGASSALLLIRVAEAHDQRLLDETLVAEGVRVEEGPTGSEGVRPVRLHAERGPIALRYAAGVEVDGAARVCPRDDAPLPTAGELAFDLLVWTLPSRYCPSDALGPFAAATFGDMPRTRSIIPAVGDWIRDRIAYQPGASHQLTTADQTLLARQGVCRDMAHLAVSFLRALDIPARVLAAYAPLSIPPTSTRSSRPTTAPPGESSTSPASRRSRPSCASRPAGTRPTWPGRAAAAA